MLNVFHRVRLKAFYAAHRLQLAGPGDLPVFAETPLITTAHDLHPGYRFENGNLAVQVAISKTLRVAGFPLGAGTHECVSHCREPFREGGVVARRIGDGAVIPHVGPETEVVQYLPAGIDHDKVLCAPARNGLQPGVERGERRVLEGLAARHPSEAETPGQQRHRDPCQLNPVLHSSFLLRGPPREAKPFTQPAAWRSFTRPMWNNHRSLAMAYWLKQRLLRGLPREAEGLLRDQ